MAKELIQLKLSESIDEDTIIWKYFSFPSFLHILLSDELVFRRIDKFADKLEGVMPKKAQQGFQKKLLEKTDSRDARSRVESEIKNIERYKKWAYANCWSICTHENYALWKIYLGNHKEGVAVQTTIKKLAASIKYNEEIIRNNQPIIIKDVNYRELSYSNVNQESIFTTKHKAYNYEKELRLLFKNQRCSKSDRKIDIHEGFNDMPVKLLKVDLNLLIEKVWISPFAEGWFKTTLKDLINNKFDELNFILENSEISE